MRGSAQMCIPAINLVFSTLIDVSYHLTYYVRYCSKGMMRFTSGPGAAPKTEVHRYFNKLKVCKCYRREHMCESSTANVCGYHRCAVPICTQTQGKKRLVWFENLELPYQAGRIRNSRNVAPYQSFCILW